MTQSDATKKPESGPEPTEEKSAAAIFARIGPWAGETTEEILEILAEARRTGGQRSVADF